jgi:hypothetical protein
MPNHFHLVLWPYRDGDLGRWMQWLLTNPECPGFFVLQNGSMTGFDPAQFGL